MIGIIVLILDTVVCITIGVLLAIHASRTWEYDNIQLLTTQSIRQKPLTYFQVDDGIDQLTNQHGFSYWKGMSSVRDCVCLEQDSNHYCLLRKCYYHVDGVEGSVLSTWRNTSFVSQSSINHNYYTLLKQAKPQNVPCDEGYKQCGILDSFNQKLCLLENETCPLNQIEISTSETPSDIFTNKEAVNTTLLNDNKTYLHTSNAEIHSQIITEIIIGPELFCFDAEERKLGPPYYYYEPSSTYGNCTKYIKYEKDFRYVPMDTQTKYDVYNENGILPKIQEYVKYYTEPYPQDELNNYNLSLYKRNYIGFNLTCLGKQELDEGAINFVRKYESLVNELNISITVIVFVQSVIFMIFAGLYFNGDKCNVLSYLVGLSLSLVLIPLITISFSLSMGSTNSIFKCADGPIYERFNKSVSLDLVLIIVSFGLYILMIVIDLILIFIENCSKIITYCKAEKKRIDLAKLGFKAEGNETELRAF